MPDSPATTSEPKTEHSAWAVPAGLAAAIAAYNLVLNPTHRAILDSSEWLSLLALGVVLVQPLLLAAWAALGPGVIIYRLPITVGILIAWIFAQTYVALNLSAGEDAQSFLDFEMTAAFVVGFAIAAVLLGLVRRFSGIHIARPALGLPSPPFGQFQFGVRYLLGWMTVCALLIVIGRTFISDSLRLNQPWLSLFLDAAVGIAFLLLLMTPPALLPIFALTRPIPWRWILAVVVLWPTSLWLIPKVLGRSTAAAPPADFTLMCIELQIGATTTALACAIALRLAGFRLVRTFQSDSPPGSV